MSQRTWPGRPTSAAEGGETGTWRQSPSAPLVGSDGWPAETSAGGPGSGENSGASGASGALRDPRVAKAPKAPKALAAWARVTARGAALAMFALFLSGDLLAGWLNVSAIVGLSFGAGCLLAAACTQRHDLLLMVTMPPLIFLIAVLCGEVITSPGSTFAAAAGAVAAGTVLTLAAAAPWLFGGALLCLILAIFRGLPQCVRDLGRDLRGQGAEADRPG
jgi:hypothetical protein